MTAIVVAYEGWLGVGHKYLVRVDGREVGRLGRRTKRVRAEVEDGQHTLSVEFNGNRTPEEHVNVAQAEEIHFVLNFASVRAAVAERSSIPFRQRIAQPIGRTPGGFMTLRRLD